MSLFNGTDQAPKFEELVGEGKKYADADAVAKAIVEKDNFIEQLKREKAAQREEILSRPPAVDRTQEILDQLEALKRREPITEAPHTSPRDPVEETKGLSLDDIEKVIQKREARIQAQTNVNIVKQKLLEQFGDNYGTAVKALAEKNGLSPEALDNLAAQSPQLVLNLVGQAKTERGFVPPASTVQPKDGFVPTSGGHKPRSWWNTLKAQDKTSYFSKEMEMRQYKDAMALGEAFEDV